MNLHEYQAKEIFRKHGIPVPDGEVATTPDEAESIAKRMGGTVVVKAQVHTGGRGKAGGVKLAKTAAEAREKAGAILGMDIKGHTVRKILVTRAADIVSETYLGFIMNREKRCPTLMFSAAGGMDIEQVAAETPEKIITVDVDPLHGLDDFAARGAAFQVQTDGKLALVFAAMAKKLYRVFEACDASLVEVNPLVVDAQGKVWAVDGKLSVDDNALDRHPDLAALRDVEEEGQDENEAREAGLSFVKLSGRVGCMVNGAGLAMATMDMVKHYGSEPANFLDIGGSSNPDKVVAALQIILRDPSVKSILINIFGGITRGDDVARGLVQAFGRFEVKVPVVVRLTGTNEKEALEILKQIDVRSAKTMDEAVETAVKLAAA